MSDPIVVRRTIHAPAEKLYALVSDLPRMGEWSPENAGGRWLAGATGATVGATFKGSNRNGIRRWSTTCTVTAAEPSQRFAFAVRYGPLDIAEWSYDLEPGPDHATTVIETFADHRQGWMRQLGGLVTGVSDRDRHNRDGMEATLAALAAEAEPPR
jgi:uncharacterized protein YndB with AHSA1/START domain